MKICSKWIPVKTVSQRVREIILRSVGLLIKRQSITAAHSLLLSMFVVFSNETDGINLENGQETPCEEHKNKLIKATSSGFIEFQDQFDDMMKLANSEDETRDLLEEMYEMQNEGLQDFENPFQSWAYHIYNESKCLICYGSGINPLFIPNLIPILIKTI